MRGAAARHPASRNSPNPPRYSRDSNRPPLIAVSTNREIEDLLHKFGGIVGLKQAPDALVIIDPRHERTAVEEAVKKRIPIVALAGSDCDISKVNYPIPANDASASSIRFFVEKIVDAWNDGKRSREAEAVAAAPAKEEKAA